MLVTVPAGLPGRLGSAMRLAPHKEHAEDDILSEGGAVAIAGTADAATAGDVDFAPKILLLI